MSWPSASENRYKIAEPNNEIDLTADIAQLFEEITNEYWKPPKYWCILLIAN